MVSDPRVVELINADIDAEIGVAEKAELEAILARDPDAKAMHTELSALASTLDSLPDLNPPSHIKHTILASIPKPEKKRSNVLQSLFVTPALRYAATFAAGAILTLSLVSSERAQDRTFNDVSGLVGTMTAEVPEGHGIRSAEINRPEVAGRLLLRSSGQFLIVDFDLVSSRPVEIVATYNDQAVWFNGFAQLESPGAAISAESGRVTMHIDGKRRYALFLHHGGDRDVEINLQFQSDGKVIYDTDVRYEQHGPNS